jgi:DNA-binding response OmpR family regulator
MRNRHSSSRDQNSGRTAAGAERILVVEDDQAALAGCVELLAAAGYAVAGAATFDEARRALRPAPDLLITDVRLGAYNGLHLIARARAHRRHIPAIVLTAFPDDVIRAEARQMGAIYLEKPVDSERLLATVARALAQASP